MENETTKTLIDEIMKLSMEDKRDLINTLIWDNDNIVEYLVWDRGHCIYQYLGDWDNDYDELDDDISFSEEEYEEVRNFLNERNDCDLIWDILGLDEIETTIFVNSYGVINDGYETRSDYFEWDYETIVEKVLGHPLYKSYKRDIKMKELGL